MKGIKYDLKTSKVILKKLGLGGKFLMINYRKDWPKPEISYPNQVLVKTLLGGICASDLHHLDIEVSYIASILANPEQQFQNGHEIVGEIIAKGTAVKDLEIGDRVIYNPVANCEAYGFSLCPSCQKGNYSSCYALAGIGDGSELEQKYGGRGAFGGFGGGGFSEFFVAFDKQLHTVPSVLPNEVAVLAEPYSIAIHAVARHLPENDDTVVVIGIGIIGMLIIAALRAFDSNCQIIALARYPFQAEIAKKMGANEVIIESDRTKLYQKIASQTQGRLFKPILSKKVLFGNAGPDLIFDCVATERSMDDALHLVRSNGKIVIVGMGYTKTKKIDWSIQCYKELEITGSFMHGIESYQGKQIDSFALALDFLKQEQEKYQGLVSHIFGIDDYKQAFKCSNNKGRNRAIKVVFDFTH